MGVLRVHALLRGSNSHTSRSPEAVDWIICVCVTEKCKPLCLWRGVAYIECARTPVSPRHRGFKVHKDGGVTGNICNKDT